MNILIVEDSATLRHSMCRYIKNAGHTPVIAENGEHALQLFTPQSVDMIIMDIEMPGLDGLETTKIIRDCLEDYWIPIIFVTGKNDEADLKLGIEVGGDDYLIKPVSETILAAKIHAMERIIAMRNELSRLNANLVELSERDGLTKLYNRRTFDQLAETAWKQASRNNEPLSILIMDIDHFKQFNDSYGHLRGDDCIERVAESIQDSLTRPGDIVARYGGEEFIVLLPNTHEDGAYNISERIRENIENLNIKHHNSLSGSTVTISVGGAVIHHTSGTALLEQVHAADKALYASKAAGRNCVTVKRFNPKTKILVADTGDDIIQMVDGKLHQYFALLHARNGQETIDLATKNRPDVILIHEDIKALSALETARILRADCNTAQIPILGITREDANLWLDHDKGIEAESCYSPEQAHKKLVAKLNAMLF